MASPTRAIVMAVATTALLLLISIQLGDAQRLPSPYCRSPGEITAPEALKLKARGNFEHMPLLSRDKDFSLSTGYTVHNVSGLGDGDRCCKYDATSLGYKCGVEFTASTGDVRVAVDLGDKFFVNQVATMWHDPCNNLPRVSYDVQYINSTGGWETVWTRPLAEEPCFYLTGDDNANDVAACLDYLKPGIVAQFVAVEFNNFLNAPAGGHIFEFEVHGIPLTQPRTMLANVTALTAVPSDLSVPIPTVGGHTGNELDSSLAGIDTVTTTASLTVHFNGKDVTKELLFGNLASHPATVSNGVVAWTGIQLLSPASGTYTITLSSPGLRDATLTIDVVPGPPRTLQLVSHSPAHVVSAPVPLGYNYSNIPDTLAVGIQVPVTSSPLRIPTLQVAMYDAGGSLSSTTSTYIQVSSLHPDLNIEVGGQRHYEAVHAYLNMDLVEIDTPVHGSYAILISSNDTAIATALAVKLDIVPGPATALRPDNPLSLAFQASGVSAFKPVSIVAIDPSGGIAAPFPPGLVGARSSTLDLSGPMFRTLSSNQVSFVGLFASLPQAGSHIVDFGIPGLMNATLPVVVAPGQGAQLQVDLVDITTLVVIPASSGNATGLEFYYAESIVLLKPRLVSVVDVAGNRVVNYPVSQVTAILSYDTGNVDAVTKKPILETVPLNGTFQLDTAGPSTPFAIFADLTVSLPKSGKYVMEFRLGSLIPGQYHFEVRPGQPYRLTTDWAGKNGVFAADRDLALPVVTAKVSDVAGNPVLSTYVNNTAIGNSSMSEWDLVAWVGATGEVAGTELMERTVVGQPVQFSFVLPRTPAADYELVIRASASVDSTYNLVPSRDAFSIVLGQPDQFVIRVDVPPTYEGQLRAFEVPPELYLIDPAGNELPTKDIPVTAEVIPVPESIRGSVVLSDKGVVKFQSLAFLGQASTEYQIHYYSKDSRLKNGEWEGYSRKFTTLSCKEVRENSVRDPVTGRCVCAPGTNRSPTGACELCGRGFYSLGVDAEGKEVTQCDQCPIHQTTDLYNATKLSDCKCEFGYYRFNRTIGTPCNECPTGARCPGGMNITAASGFWRGSPNSITFYKCQLEDVCPGGDVATCTTGYEGPMCASCQVGYGRLGRRCVTCPEGGLSWVLLALWAVCLIGAFAWVIRISRADSVPALHGRILLNFVQLALVISGIPYLWNHRISELLHGLSLVFLLSINFVSADCIFRITYYSELIITASIPVIALALALIFNYIHWLLSYRFSKKPERRAEAYYPGVRSEYVNEAFRQTLAVWMFVNPAIIRASLRVYTCDQFDDQSSLSYDVRVTCGSTEYEHWTLVASAIFLIYGVGLIFVLAYALWRARPSSMEAQYDSGRLEDRMGFVYAPFRQRFWWWELLTNLFKLILVCAVANGKEYRDFLLTVTICLAIVMHVVVNPYQAESLRLNSVGTLFCLYVFFQMSHTFMTTNQSTDVTSFGDPEESLAIYYLLHFLLFVVCLMPVYMAAHMSIRSMMRRRRLAKASPDHGAELLEQHSITLVGDYFEDAVTRGDIAWRIR